LNTISGLPAHPLIVHFPLVAIPMAAILVALFIVKPSWRDVLSYLIIALGAAIAIGVVLAASSGESLKENVDKSAKVDSHAELGDQLQTIGVIFGIVLIALGLYYLLAQREIIHFEAVRSRQLLIILMAGAVLMSTVAVVWDVRTGHTGAQASWSEKGQEGQGENGGDGDDARVLTKPVTHVLPPANVFTTG
jgi:uncharacterized membrane protein